MYSVAWWSRHLDASHLSQLEHVQKGSFNPAFLGPSFTIHPVLQFRTWKLVLLPFSPLPSTLSLQQVLSSLTPVYIWHTSTAFSVPQYPLIQPIFISKLNYYTSLLTDLFTVTLAPSNLSSTCKVVRSCLSPLHKTFHLLSIALRKKSQIFSGQFVNEIQMANVHTKKTVYSLVTKRT